MTPRVAVIRRMVVVIQLSICSKCRKKKDVDHDQTAMSIEIYTASQTVCLNTSDIWRKNVHNTG